jgi:SWI/SNF-related matrix-associated actin-dependent regulator 1 of chromatin subfamily A
MDDRAFALQREAFRLGRCRWDGVARGWLGERAMLPKVLSALDAAGFSLDVDESLEGAIVAPPPAAAAPTLPPIALPDGVVLYPHQQQGIDFLRLRAREGKSSLLADDMGLGKTAQTLLSLPDGAPVLVVCPKIAKGVWSRETRKFRPAFSVATLEGRGSFRWPKAGEIVVVNFDVLPKAEKRGGDAFATLDPSLGKAPQGLVVVVDEAHKAKNAKAQRSTNLRAITHAAREAKGHAILLTGTPLLNKPQEVWSILVAGNLHREAFSSLAHGYADVFPAAMRAAGGEEGRYGWEFSPSRVSPAFGECLRRVSLRRTKDEVLNLPAKRFETLSVEVDGVGIADTLLRKAAAAGIDLDHADLAKLRGSLDFEMLSAAREAMARAKIPALLDLVEDCEEQEEPVLVFSAHRAPVEACGKREGWATITGTTSTDERARIEADFQAGKLRGVAATIAAAGVALTLTRASRVIFCDLSWTPADNDQACDRAYRIGQTKSILVTTLVADHKLDERIHALLAFKASLNNATVEVVANTAPILPEAPVAPAAPKVTIRREAVEDDFSDLPF